MRDNTDDKMDPVVADLELLRLLVYLTMPVLFLAAAATLHSLLHPLALPIWG